MPVPTSNKEAQNFEGLALGLRGGTYINLGTQVTTAPTTALDQGDLFLAWGGTIPQIGVVYTGNTIAYFTYNTVTFGRQTAA